MVVGIKWSTPTFATRRVRRRALAPDPRGASEATSGREPEREVDHQAAIAHCGPGHVMTGTAHGHNRVVLPSEVHGGNNVAGTGAPQNDGGTAIDHRVVDALGRAVGFV